MERRRALLTTIPSDSHSWNLVFMEMFLQEMGFEVRNLGVCVPIELLVDACERFLPDLVVVSTVNGHGYIECIEIAERLAELPFRDRLQLVAGGKLLTTKDEERLRECADQLRAAGYADVYVAPDALARFRESLQPDQHGATG